MKRCTKCKTEKPVEAFSKHKTSKDGLRPDCKVCANAASKAWREANKARKAATNKAWREANKERHNAASKAWRKANPERQAAARKAWLEANPERQAAARKAWRKANPERAAAAIKAWVKANPERQAAARKAWCEANPEKRAAFRAKRRAAELQRTPPWLTQEHQDQIVSIYAERDRLTDATGVQHHVDHIIPMQGKTVSGLHVPWNLQVLTASENCSKQNTWSEA